jgi:hypothetical protein
MSFYQMLLPKRHGSFEKTTILTCHRFQISTGVNSGILATVSIIKVWCMVFHC